MMSKKKLITSTLVALSLFSTISVSATTYLSDTLTGTNAESTYVNLGSGTRYVKGTAVTNSGTLHAMKIIPYAPDKSVANISLSAPNSGQASFTAVNTNDNGVVQSYYLKWKGSNSKSKVNGSFTN
ncbi:hypothetical protein [uncultured Clostridium sp.]|uniref:hypothetical protein n=1 Tax=uncultured Clostridium sp. TaxID=59620 RepID=UPI002729FBF9|nr:hypothetical protein [uncultured Clostridium sp.]